MRCTWAVARRTTFRQLQIASKARGDTITEIGLRTLTFRNLHVSHLPVRVMVQVPSTVAKVRRIM